MAKTYTAVPNVSTLQTYASSDYNTYTATNISNLIVPPACKAVRTSIQTIANTTTTALQLDAADEFDTDNMHDTVTNNTRITVNTPGLFIITGGVGLVSNATGNYRLVGIRKNGSTELANANMTGAAAGNDPRFFISCIDFATAGSDYYELVVYQDSGGNLNTKAGVTTNHAYLTVSWIGRTS